MGKIKSQGFLNAPSAQKRDFSLEGPQEQKQPSPAQLEQFQAFTEAQKQYKESKEGQEEAKPEAVKEPESKKVPEKEPVISMDNVPAEGDVFLLDEDRKRLLQALMSPEEEEAAAKRSSKLTIKDVFDFGEFKQVIEIMDGLIVTFRSVSNAETLQIHHMVMEKYEKESSNYILEYTTLLNLACTIKGINGEEFPYHMGKSGFDQKIFDEKFERVISLPNQINAMLSVHSMWFDKRIRKLFLRKNGKESAAQEEIKNG